MGCKMSKRNNKKVSIKTYVLSLVVNVLTDILPLGLKGGYKDKDIYNIVINASSRRTSINQVCNDLKTSPKSRTVRHHLKKLKMKILESNINKILLSYGLTSLHVAMQMGPYLHFFKRLAYGL